MDNFATNRRTVFLFGVDQEKSIGVHLKYYGGSYAMLVYSSKVVETGLIDTIRRSLERSGVDSIGLQLDDTYADLTPLDAAIARCKENRIDFILAIGNENIISSAKAIAVGAEPPDDINEILSEGLEPESALPLGVIVTEPGTGAELSDTMVISRKNTHGGLTIYESSGECIIPRFAVLNPELTDCFPSRLGDVCANLFARVAESYFTNSRCVELTDRVCEGIMSTVKIEIEKLLEYPHNNEAIANLMWAGVLANGETSLDREQDLALERFAYAFSSLYGCSHAQGMAVVLPAWLEFVLNHNPMRLAQFSSRVFGRSLDFANPITTARQGIVDLRNMFGKCGLPSKLEDIGGSGKDISRLLDLLIPEKSRTIGSYVKLDRTACEVILAILMMH
ncbi:MAG: iron-containing alcohol dehydrogenase [Succinivibrio sp.]|nr:iron-containing alcohol dehydrogenase [Succinivibrio sp.]